MTSLHPSPDADITAKMHRNNFRPEEASWDAGETVVKK
jgi:hypothetical protein